MDWVSSLGPTAGVAAFGMLMMYRMHRTLANGFRISLNKNTKAIEQLTKVVKELRVK